MKLRYLIRRFFLKNYKLISETAYHEAGHVCMAYFAGFTVEKVAIDYNGNGKTFINYGGDDDVVLALFDLETTAATFNALPTERKSKFKSTAYRLTNALVGGPIAEARFIALKNKDEIANVIVEYTDYKMSKNIERSLNNILLNQKMPLLIDHTKEQTEKVSDIMSLKEIWNSIDMVAKSILNSAAFELEESEIKKILDKCGFDTFVRNA